MAGLCSGLLFALTSLQANVLLSHGVSYSSILLLRGILVSLSILGYHWKTPAVLLGPASAQHPLAVAMCTGAVGSILFVYSLGILSLSLASAIVSTQVLWTSVGSSYGLGETNRSVLTHIAMLLVLLGCVLVFFDAEYSLAVFWGSCVALTSSVLLGTSYVSIRAVALDRVPDTVCTFAVALACAALSLVAMVLDWSAVFPSTLADWGLLVGAALSHGMAYVALVTSIRVEGPVTGSLLNTSQIFFAAILQAGVLGDSLSVLETLQIALIFAGVVIVHVDKLLGSKSERLLLGHPDDDESDTSVEQTI